MSSQPNLELITAHTLKGPNVFRLRVPLVIKNFLEEFKPDSTTATGPNKIVTSVRLHSSVVVGNRFADSWWTLEARHIRNTWYGGANFYLTFGGESFIQLTAERFICLTCTSGEIHQIDDIRTEKKGHRFHQNEPTELGLLTAHSVRQNPERYLFNGDLHLAADVTFRIDSAPLPPVVKAEDHLMSLLKAEFVDPTYSDFTLIGSDGVMLKTHKMLLGLVSPVFKAMFDTDCNETRDGVCTIEDADGEGIRGMLDCILEADVQLLPFKLVQKIFSLADKYELTLIKQSCALKLANELNMDCVLDVLVLADQHSDPRLKNECFIFMEDNLELVITNNLVVKLLEIGRAVNRPLYEEWQSHVNLRSTGVPLKRASEDEPANSATGSASKRPRNE